LEALPFATRLALADQLRRSKRSVAEAANAAFLVAHPDWITRYGDRARERGIEDAEYHLEYLAGAIATGALAAFEDYARWTRRVLAARGISPTFLAEHFAHCAEVLLPTLAPPGQSLVQSVLQAGQRVCLEQASDPSQPAEGPLQVTQRVFLQALLTGQRKAATELALETVQRDVSISDFYTGVLEVSLYEIGRRWEANELTVADEHAATAIAQYVMALLYPLIELPTTQRGHVVVTGVRGELHQIGANMVADILEADGWNVRFLGTNLPAAAIADAVRSHQAQVVGISTTMLFNIPLVVELMERLHTLSLATPLRIWLGGGAFRHAPHLYQQLGADGFAATLDDTVILLRSWSAT
jgi:methanogenic corrinoid protein MtbC1